MLLSKRAMVSQPICTTRLSDVTLCGIPLVAGFIQKIAPVFRLAIFSEAISKFGGDGWNEK
jgi:hypothetical protein